MAASHPLQFGLDPGPVAQRSGCEHLLWARQSIANGSLPHVQAAPELFYRLPTHQWIIVPGTVWAVIMEAG